MLSAKRLAIILYISIHAPTWGATGRCVYLRRLYGSFNPRSHMGSDLSNYHAALEYSGFNPRSHMGSDVELIDKLCGEHMFQSTLPYGKRPPCGLKLFISYCVSIHAPTWGATEWYRLTLAIFRFQSTLPHGERQKAPTRVPTGQKFQSTLPHGERHSGQVNRNI